MLYLFEFCPFGNVLSGVKRFNHGMCLNSAGLCKYLNLDCGLPRTAVGTVDPKQSFVCQREGAMLCLHTSVKTQLSSAIYKARSDRCLCERVCLHVSFNRVCPDVSSYRAVLTICVCECQRKWRSGGDLD